MDRKQNIMHARRLRRKIKETWSKLDEQELAFYRVSPAEFYKRLNEKYGVSHESAKAIIEEFEAESMFRNSA